MFVSETRSHSQVSAKCCVRDAAAHLGGTETSKGPPGAEHELKSVTVNGHSDQGVWPRGPRRRQQTDGFESCVSPTRAL